LAKRLRWQRFGEANTRRASWRFCGARVPRLATVSSPSTKSASALLDDLDVPRALAVAKEAGRPVLGELAALLGVSLRD
jgi:hypothetical protein